MIWDIGDPNYDPKKPNIKLRKKKVTNIFLTSSLDICIFRAVIIIQIPPTKTHDRVRKHSSVIPYTYRCCRW